MKKIITLAFSLTICCSLFGETFTWAGGNGDWNDANNWNCTNCPATPTNIDDVIIPSGAVNITADISVNSIDLSTDASIIGNGKITLLNFINNGSIIPGGSGVIEIIEIENLTGTDIDLVDAKIEIDNGANDKINATNSGIILSGDLTVSLLNGFTPNAGDVFTLITSTGSISGSFVNTSSCYVITYNTNSVTATYSPNTFYLDNDGDGFGDPNTTTESCESTPPAGYANNDTDCDDNDDTVLDSYSASISGDLGFCPEGNTDLTASGGAGYTYQWDPNGETTNTINVNTADSYSVTVTTPLGCTDVATKTVVEHPLPNVNFNVSNTSGSNDPMVFCSFNFTNGSFNLAGPTEQDVTYSWTTDPTSNITFVNDQVAYTGATVSNSTANEIPIDVTFTAINTVTGCTDNSIQTVIANREVVIDNITRTENSGTPNDGGVCFGDDIDLEGFPLHTTGNYTYDWSLSSNGSPIEFTGNPYTATPIYDNTFTVYYLTATDDYSCSDTELTSAKGITEVVTNLTYVQDCVNGDSIVLTMSGGSPIMVNGMPEYQVFENGAGLGQFPSPYKTPIFISPGATASYTFSATDVAGCGSSASTTIQVPDDVDNDGFRSDCDCDDTDADQFPGQVWYIDADGDTYGGSSVTQCARPTDGFLLSELTGTGTDDCDDNDADEVPDQIWYIDADGDTYGSSAVTQCERPIDGFLLSDLSGNGTDDCDDADANVLDIYIASISGDLGFCPEGSTDLTASGGNEYTYLWTPNNETTQTITASTVGNYTVEITSPAGCIDTETVTIFEHGLPNTDFVYLNNSGSNQLDVYCSSPNTNSTFILNGPPEANVDYTWSINSADPAATISFIDDESIFTGATVSNSAADPVDIDVTFTAINSITGCTDFTTKTITANRLVEVTTVDRTDDSGSPNDGGICFGDVVNFEALMLHNTGTYTYTWSGDPSGNPVSSTDNPWTMNPIYDNAQRVYYVEAIDEYNCKDSTGNFTSAKGFTEVISDLTFVQNCIDTDSLIFNFSGGAPTIVNGQPIYFLLDEFENGLTFETPPFKFEINPGLGVDSTYVFTAKDEKGCSTTASISVQIPDDSDGDSVRDDCDNCPNDPNKSEPGQCGCGNPDTDTDSDGTADCNDNCPNDANKIEPGVCGCGIADTDTDGDGTEDCNDACPNDPNKIIAGICGCGVSDIDTDGDSTPDCNDNCPNDASKTEPGVCGCGIADTDTDGDGTEDCNDDCPNDPNKIAFGECGCDVADTDSDNDGTADCNDNCPSDPSKIEPGDCGCGIADTDTDGDTLADCIDPCPTDPTNMCSNCNDPCYAEFGTISTCQTFVDTDGDGTCDANDACPNDANKIATGQCGCGVADTDSDEDGTADCNDGCPNDANKIAAGACGCGTPDIDTDGDGTEDCNDLCPNDANKIAPGICGCNASDIDTDGDSTPDCNDGCPNDINKIAPGVCGCGTPDTDTDGDGTEDCNDTCPNDPNKIAPGQCGCDVADTDTDGDGTADCNDGCPNDINKTSAGVCGCGVADTDTDGDGTEDCNDACPNDSSKTTAGQCGCGVADTDSDNDGTSDCIDGCPNDINKTAPGDCGCGIADTDSDGDTLADCIDPCPSDPTNMCSNCNDPCFAEFGTTSTCQTFVDSDSDGTCDANDDCPNDANKIAAGQCGCGNLETDSDSDGTADCNDGCPNDANKTAPGDCGCGVSDIDSDGDNTPDCNDGCPNDANKTAPGNCGCGIADIDTDGDNTPDCNDACPNDPNKIASGQCGCGTADTDTDNDGTADCNDGCPNDPNKVAPGDCGCGIADTDSDGDNLADCIDPCPNDATNMCNNCNDPCFAEFGTTSTCQTFVDSDGDGTCDANDDCPNDANKIAAGQCGCGNLETDSDSDGTADCNDGCPNDANKIAPGDCGCGVADTDTDGDGIEDCNDACPNDPNNTCNSCNDPCYAENGTNTPCQNFQDADGDGTCDANDDCPNDANKIAAGQCGCGNLETDSDSDGTADCNDGCPNDANKIAPGDCGCGVADTDTDGDGIADCNDTCPNDPNNTCNSCNDPCYAENGTSNPCQNFQDADGDGTCDANDGCPNDANKIAPGDCGCGVADTDTDADGIADCNDACPNDINKTSPGTCGCGNIDDADGDGYPGCTTDCDDTNSNINPSTSEICGNSIDDNCDGNIDEGCGGYCASNGLNTNGNKWIKRVRYGNLNNATGNDNGYGDYTHLAANITAGQNEVIRLRPRGNHYMYWNVYIDFNQDLDFDDVGELVVHTSGTGQRNVNITLPMSATSGATRMRVTMSYNNYCPGPCSIFQYGEVEDYAVNITVPPCGNMPGGWTETLIGTHPTPSYACYDQAADKFKIASSGFDIFGSGDDFSFIHTDLCGDGEIIAKINNITNTGSYALAGIMLREDLAQGSKYAGNFKRPSGTFLYQRRKNTNGSTASAATSNNNNKKWVKLVREGNKFTGYVSNNGNNWTATYFTYINMPNCIKAGLAVTNYHPWKLNVSNFTGVEVLTGVGNRTALSDDYEISTLGQESLEDRETKIAAFSAYRDQLDVKLEWFTGQEYFNDYFEIERSTDGIDFEKIGELAGKTFSSDASGYHFYDKYPKTGINYYRIKQVNQAGEIFYTEIKEIEFNLNLGELNVFPNPADRAILLYDERFVGLPTKITVANQLGVELQKFDLPEMPGDPFRIDLTKYPDGFYIIQVKAEGFRRISKPFVISKD